MHSFVLPVYAKHVVRDMALHFGNSPILDVSQCLSRKDEGLNDSKTYPQVVVILMIVTLALHHLTDLFLSSYFWNILWDYGF